MGLIHLADTGIAGNVNKDFVIPGGKQYRALFGASKLTTDATVANRWLRLAILDPNGVNICCLCPGATVTASQSDMLFSYLQGVYRETSFINSVLQVPIAQDLIVPTGYTIRFFVDNGVAGDSFDCDLMCQTTKY